MRAAARLPTLLLPGIDGSGRLFDPLLAAGPRGFAPRVVPLPADRPRSYDEYLELLLEALPRRGSFGLLAESFSGPLAVRLAAARPRGLTALALVATFLDRPLQPWLAPFSPLVGPALFAAPLLPAVVRLLLAGGDAPDAVVAALRAATAAVPAAVLARRAREALVVDVRSLLASTTLPLLYLGPTGDRLLRTDVIDDVLAARPDAETALLDGPHTLLQVRPQACLARLDPFFGGTAGRATGRTVGRTTSRVAGPESKVRSHRA
ncbi:MAG: alpha/beta hydrolase [Anaeromyxobacter sp.]|nr:alpha/beta hydrolase [Anaeromyxobacter sp.]MBL0277312.1 alpha/beta hydrolase [Anaeromyxobacter sp.]